MRTDHSNYNNDVELYLIKILYDHIHRLITHPIECVNWQNLYALSKNHEVTGIVYYQCKEFIPKEYSYEFESAYAASIYYYSNFKNAIAQICKVLKDNGINAFLLKGPEVARNYPLPYLRTMGDADIVVEPGTKKNAIRILRQIGFEGNNDEITDTWCGKRGELHIEVHDTLVKRIEFANNKQVEFFNNYMKYYQDGGIDWSYHFLFLVMHLRKHFMAEGVGLRQFMDIAMVIRNNPKLNWRWIEERANELDLQRFAHSCYSLIYKWFGINAPVDFEELQESTFEEVTKTIMKDGVFGFSDDNRDYKARNAMIFERGPIWLRRITFLLRKLFPSYEEMIGYPGCSFLKGKDYLLPISWFVRFKFIIMDKSNHSRMRTVNSTFVSLEECDKKKAIFEELGLL